MNIKELIDKFYEEADKLRMIGKLKIGLASKYSDNGEIFAAIVEAKSGKAFIYGEATNENETGDECFSDPDVATDLKEAVTSLCRDCLDEDDYSSDDLVFEKVPNVTNDCYWIHPDHVTKEE